MYNVNIKILLKYGFHIRPIVKIVKLSNKFKSDINIFKKNKIANAKDLFQIQKLGIIFKDIIILSANGNDELIAIKNLKNLINNIL